MLNDVPLSEIELDTQLEDILSNYGITNLNQLLHLYRNNELEFKQFLLQNSAHLESHIEELFQQLAEISFSYDNHNSEHFSQNTPFKCYRLPKKINKPFEVSTAKHLTLTERANAGLQLTQLGPLAHLELTTPVKLIFACIQSFYQKTNNSLSDAELQYIEDSFANVGALSKWSNQHNNIVTQSVCSDFDQLLSFTEQSSMVSFLKASLSGLLYPKPKPVLVELPVYSWLNFAAEQGNQIPMPFEKPLGHFPIVISGYKNDQHSLGGGIFEVQTVCNDEVVSFTLPFAYLANLTLPVWIIQGSQDIDLSCPNKRKNIPRVINYGKQLNTFMPFYSHPSNLPNEHLLIVGGTGYGKTSFIKNSVQQLTQISSADKNGHFNQDCIHIFALQEDDHQSLEPDLIIDALKCGLPFNFLTNPKKQPINHCVNDKVQSINKAFQLGSNQLAEITAIIRQGFDFGWNNYQFADAIEASKIKTLANKLAPLLLLLRSDKPTKINFAKQKGMVVHKLDQISNADTLGAYITFMMYQLMDYKEQNKDHKLYLIFEETSTLNKKANNLLEYIFCSLNKFGVAAYYVVQQVSTVPSFVLDNTATKIWFDESKLSKKMANITLGRYQAVVEQPSNIQVITTMPFVKSKNQPSLSYKPNFALPNLSPLSTESKLVQSLARVNQHIKQWLK